MKLLDRYIVRNFLTVFIFCIISFLFLCIIIDLFNHLDDILSMHIPFSIVFQYYVLFIPFIFAQSSPIAVLISVIFLLGIMKKNNEITILRSIGNNNMKILSPLFITGLLIGLFAFYNNNFILPQSITARNHIDESYFSADSNDKNAKKKKNINIASNVTILGKSNRMYYAKQFNKKTNTLSDVIILEHNQKNQLTAKTTINKMIWKNKLWIGTDILKSNLNPRSGQLVSQPQFFDKAQVNIDEEPADFNISHNNNIELLNMKELYFYAKKFKSHYPKMARTFIIEFYNRFTPIVSICIVILLATSVSLRIQKRELFVGLGKTTLFILLYYFSSAALLTFAKSGVIPILIAALMPHILFAAFGFLMLFRDV